MKTRTLFPVILALAVLASACGGGSDETSEVSSDAAADAQDTAPTLAIEATPEPTSIPDPTAAQEPTSEPAPDPTAAPETRTDR